MASEKNINFFDMGLSDTSVATENSGNTVDIPDGFSLDNTLEIIEKQYIAAALERSGNNKSQAARLLGFSNYQRLDARIKSLKIQPELE